MQSTVHEIRNQLAVAVANIEAFIDGKIKPTPDRLNSVLRALLEVDVLIDDLPRGKSRDREPAMESVDVCRLIENELIAIEAAASAARIELRVDRCAAEHPECSAFMCDPGQVSQILKNVLLNAIKFTSSGGFIAVDCRREPGVMALTVSDDGPGVPADERAAIFQAGVRGSAAEPTPGTGMGLAVVQRIVDSHGGSVTVGPSEFGGAAFIIRLPGQLRFNPSCDACAHTV